MGLQSSLLGPSVTLLEHILYRVESLCRYYTGLCKNSHFSMWFPPQPFISMKREWQVRGVYRPPLPLAHPSGFGLVWFWFEEEGQSSGSGSVCGLVWRWEGIEQEEVYTCNFLIQSLGSVLLCLQPLAWGLHREHQCLTVAQWSSLKLWEICTDAEN